MINNLLLILTLLFSSDLLSQITKEDSLRKSKQLLEEAKVESQQKEIKMTIRNVDISHYPTIKLIVEAFNIYGVPLDTLDSKNLSVMENGVEKKVISVEKISIDERIPVDFCFVVDQTGSMQSYIDALYQKMNSFSQSINQKGIDFTLSLIVFSDFVEDIKQPTTSVGEFLSWIGKIKATGGGDAKENALKALDYAIKKIKYRPSANKVLVLVTDAPYHQVGENGIGETDHNTQSIIKLLTENEARVFCITAPRLTEYKIISEKTRGNTFDMDYPFSAILENFSNQLTNLYAIKYTSSQPAIPDSIAIGIINEKKQTITQKTIAIVELGRKLIIENMLFTVGQAELPEVVAELDVLTEFMKNKPSVSITVEGHTDNTGSDKINDYLSKKRADAVKVYLQNKGISPKRIKTVGLGKRRPIASNDTDWGRRLNRRTEVIISKK